MADRLWGRVRELAALDARLDAALGGRPHLVVVRGEPGIGKTRLVEELVDRATARGVATAWGRCTDPDGAPPYRPWRRLLTDLPPVDDPHGLVRADVEHGDLPDAGADLLHEASGGTGPADPAGDTAAARSRLFDAVAARLRGAAAPAGLVVVLDDLHAADRSSLLLLRHVVRELGRDRVLLLATARDTEPHGPLDDVLADLGGGSALARLELAGLAPEAVAAQLRHLVGVPLPDGVADAVARTSGGNPFFVAELARVIAAGGPPGPPSGVRDQVAGRVARLPGVTRSLLDAASVLGSPFGLDLLAQIAGSDPPACLAGLEDAVVAGLVEPLDPPGGFRFTHDLVRDAVDAALTGDRRARWHRACAEALEARHTTRPGPHLAELARHWTAAAVLGDRARAAGWITRAAQEAMRRLAPEEAARLHALALDVGADDLDPEQRMPIAVALVEARREAGDEAGALTACREATDGARALGRPVSFAEAVLAMGCPRDPEADRVVRGLGDEALAGLGADASTALRARLLALRAETGVFLDDAAGAETASARALVLAESDGSPAALLPALRVRQMVRSGPDGLEDRIALAARLAEVGAADTTDTRRSAAVRLSAHLSRIDNALEQGDLGAADAELAPLASCATLVGGPLVRWQLLRTRATLAQAHGRFAEARELADRAVATLGATSHPAAAAMRMALLGAVEHHVGPSPETTATFSAVSARPLEVAVGYRFFDVLGAAASLTDAGQLDDAGRCWRALGPAATWRLPPYFALAARAVAVTVAVGQGALDDLAVLREDLLPYRHRHIAVPGGAANYGGPVALPLGRAAAALGDLDGAVGHLTDALASCRRSGAAGYVVEIQDELAGVLLRRGAPGDAAAAAGLIDAGLAGARALGMAPVAAALEARRAAAGPGLTRREREVAAGVARGLTNAGIASALGISQRTAQNHVQHVLTKLGFSRRSQIAAWSAREAGRPPATGISLDA